MDRKASISWLSQIVSSACFCLALRDVEFGLIMTVSVAYSGADVGVVGCCRNCAIEADDDHVSVGVYRELHVLVYKGQGVSGGNHVS